MGVHRASRYGLFEPPAMGGIPEDGIIKLHFRKREKARVEGRGRTHALASTKMQFVKRKSGVTFN